MTEVNDIQETIKQLNKTIKTNQMDSEKKSIIRQNLVNELSKCSYESDQYKEIIRTLVSLDHTPQYIKL